MGQVLEYGQELIGGGGGGGDAAAANQTQQSSGGGIIDSGTGAAIAGGAQTLGGIYEQQIDAEGDRAVAQIQANDRYTVPNPYYDAIMIRALGVIDEILTRRGVPAFIPSERMPYELRSPEERSAIQDDFRDARNEGRPMGVPPPQPLYQTAPKPGSVEEKREQTQFDNRMEARNTRPSPIPSIGAEEGVGPSYASADFAARLGSNRMGLNAPPAQPTTRDFYEQDKARKDEELNKLYRYVYGN